MQTNTTSSFLPYVGKIHTFFLLLTKRFAAIRTILTKNVFLEKESFIVIIFYIFHSWINTNRYYFILLAVYLGMLYLINRDIRKTLWLTLITTFPFQQAKYFVSHFTSASYPEARPIVVTYFIAYSDAIILMLLYVLIRHRDTTKLTATSSDLVLIPLILVAGVSTYVAHYFSVAIFGLYQLMKLFLFYGVGRLMFKERGFSKITIEAFVLFVLYNSLLIILQKTHGSPLGLAVETLNTSSLYGRYAIELRSLYRPGGFTDDPNASATILGMFIPLLAIFGITNKILHKALVWTCLAAATMALLFTASRAVWIITAIVTSVAVLRARQLSPFIFPSVVKKYWRIFLGIVLLMAGPLVLLRLTTLRQALSETGSGTSRLIHLHIASTSIFSYPFGTGLNTTPLEMASRFPPVYYLYDPSELHNIFAQVAVSLGVAGLLFYGVFLYLTLKRLASFIKRGNNAILSLGVFMTVISYLVIGNFYPWFLDVPISGFFWILAAYSL